MPDTPGVNPVEAGACEDPGVLGVWLGSWEAVALVTAVAMSAATAGALGSGMRGRAGGLICWRCSLD
ncbi:MULTISPECIES: hypothetical protein [Mycobacteroides]|uniref:hypothetical protein n=1 Tax=Mycobacteroides TaxID=670516 RepID=UPI001F16D672|nr:MULTISPECIES: hypothetical protein [Mycobacteroides]